MKIEDLQNGDLIVWRGIGPIGNRFPTMRMVRLVIMSDYGHVSIAWKGSNAMEHVEATIPKIRRLPVPANADLYTIPMGLNVSNLEMNDFFDELIGLSYSKADAVRGLLGIVTKKDDQWQCAELCHEFFKSRGLELGGAFTPSRLVREIMHNLGYPLLKLKA